MNTPHDSQSAHIPWSVDRWGRFLAGLSMLTLLLLGILHHSYWLYGAMACAANLFVSSLTDKCAVHRCLIYLGAKEREDIFQPGGRQRI